MTRHTVFTICQLLAAAGTLGFLIELMRKKLAREHKEREQ